MKYLCNSPRPLQAPLNGTEEGQSKNEGSHTFYIYLVNTQTPIGTHSVLLISPKLAAL